MRVTTEIWVSALIRRVFGEGGYAAVVAKGAAEAGAVFVTGRARDGSFTLYGPASQSDYEGKPDDRRFREILAGDDDEDLAKRLERERRFDPDLWILELDVDDAKLRSYLGLAG